MLEPLKDSIPLIVPSIELTANVQRAKVGAKFVVHFEPVKESDPRLVSALAFLIRLADFKTEGANDHE